MRTLITNIKQLVTASGTKACCGPKMGDLAVVSNAELLLEDGRIHTVKSRTTSGRAMRKKADIVVDAARTVVLPGVVDAHEHACTDPADGGDGSIDDEAADRIAQQAARSLRSALVRGTTLASVSCSWRELVRRPYDAHRADTSDVVVDALCQPEAHGSGSRGTAVERLISEAIPTIRARRLAGFCSVACGSRAFSVAEAKMVLRAAQGAGLAVKIHADGGRSEHLGRTARDAGVTAILDASLLSEVDVQNLRGSNVVVVLLPGRSMLSDEHPTNARVLVDAGLPVGVGTDGHLTGGGVQSLWLALSAAVKRNGLTLAEGIAAITLNAAAACGYAETHGTIESGKQADLVMLELSDYRDLAKYVDCVPIHSVFKAGVQVEGV